MTMTKQSPWDYNKRILIVSQLVRVCTKCGSHTAVNSTGRFCISCKGTTFREIFEHQLDDYRASLLAAQEAEAQRIVEELTPRFEQLRKDLNMIADMSDEGES